MAEPTTGPETDAQLDELLGDPQAGSAPRGGRRRRRLRPDARRRPRELPQVLAGGRQRHLPEGRPRHPPAARRRLRRRAPRLQRALPRRPALHRLLERGAGDQVPAVERDVHAAVRRRLGRRGGASATAPRRWPRSSGPPGTTRSFPSSSACRTSSCPPGTAYDDPNQHVAEADRADVPASSTPGCSRPAPTRVELSKAAARHVVPREPRVPAAVHRGVGRADRRALLARRDVRHPVDALGRHRAARARRSSRPSTSASPATPSRTG